MSAILRLASGFLRVAVVLARPPRPRWTAGAMVDEECFPGEVTVWTC
jgi:hypothetical protein